MGMGKWTGRVLIATVVVAGLAGLASCSRDTSTEEAAPVTAHSSLRHIETGDIVGFTTNASTSAAHVWRNIPYAAPPVGDLRWRAPRPAASWMGTRVSLDQPEWCHQYTNGLDRGYGYESGTLMGSEDCLYLNVFAPAFDADAVPQDSEQLPVMLWIHGGGNTWGRAEQYDGAELATRENVIVVVIQYRIGPLGWMAHPALRADAQTPMDQSANFGTLDMIASLEWVRDNIAVFGGDADRVTIFGESAGGHNVASLLASPPAAGLFHRAIIQSGSLYGISMAAAEGSAPMPYDAPLISSQDAINSVLQFIQAPNPLELASAMRSIEPEVLFDAYHRGEGNLDVPRVILDGIVLPEGGMAEAFSNPATFNNVPVMTGTNRDEMRLFNMLDERFVKTYFGMIYRARDPVLYERISHYQSLIWRVRSVDTVGQAMIGGGHNEVYAYRFDWDEEGSFLMSNFADLMGAAHGLEIPFVFGEWAFAGRADRFIFTRKNEGPRVALSDAMMDYWGSFAATGRPEGDARWGTWGSNGAHIVFDTEADGGIRMEQGALSVSDVFDLILVDPQLESDEQRCEVYRTAIVWSPELEDLTFMDGACPSMSFTYTVE